MQLEYDVGCVLGAWLAVEGIGASFPVELFDAGWGGDVEVVGHCEQVGVVGRQEGPPQSLLVAPVDPVVEVSDHPPDNVGIEGPR